MRCRANMSVEGDVEVMGCIRIMHLFQVQGVIRILHYVYYCCQGLKCLPLRLCFTRDAKLEAHQVQI